MYLIQFFVSVYVFTRGYKCTHDTAGNLVISCQIRLKLSLESEGRGILR